MKHFKRSQALKPGLYKIRFLEFGNIIEAIPTTSKSDFIDHIDHIEEMLDIGPSNEFSTFILEGSSFDDMRVLGYDHLSENQKKKLRKNMKLFKKISFWILACFAVVFLGIALLPIVLISFVLNIWSAHTEVPRSSGW